MSEGAISYTSLALKGKKHTVIINVYPCLYVGQITITVFNDKLCECGWDTPNAVIRQEFAVDELAHLLTTFTPPLPTDSDSEEVKNGG